MHGYHAVMAPIGTRCCYILPDVVGDQAGTLELARSLRPMLEHLARLDHDALIPVQRGPMSITAFVAAYRQAMGGIPVSGLAIPSNAAAMPVEELKGLAHVEDISRRVHFLGISRRARPLLDRARALAEFWPDVAISADACEHRAHVGRTRAITRSRASHLATLVANSWMEYDETEDGPLFESDHDPVREKLQRFSPDADEETLNDLIASGWGLSIQFELAGERFVSQNGPLATTHSIHEFARSQFGRAGL